MVSVGKYTIHGSYGIGTFGKTGKVDMSGQFIATCFRLVGHPKMMVDCKGIPQKCS